MLSLERWHLRYTQQAAWTQAARQYIYRRCGIERCSNILEVGCGTGAILSDFSRNSLLSTFGVDIQPASARSSKTQVPTAHISSADGYYLPFSENSFDCTLCHFFLLWCKQPVTALREMARVTRPGGSILLLAEPDHEHRIDQPEELAGLGRLQSEALKTQGANISAGSHLGEWLCAANLKINLIGLLASEWTSKPSEDDFELEWEVLAHDLVELSKNEIERIKEIDKAACQNGTRVLFVPTFYAWGSVIK